MVSFPYIQKVWHQRLSAYSNSVPVVITWCPFYQITVEVSASMAIYIPHDAMDMITSPWYNPILLQWRHNGRDGVSNHQPHGCLLNCLFRRRSKKTSKLRVTGLLAWNSPVTGEFPAQMASNAENISIWWRHHVISVSFCGHWNKITSPFARQLVYVNFRNNILYFGITFISKKWRLPP